MDKGYELIDSSEDLLAYDIKFTKGEYKDIVFNVGKIGIVEEVEKENLVLKFDFTVPSNPKLEHCKDFQQAVGDILIGVLEEACETGYIQSFEDKIEETRKNMKKSKVL